jgi:hypothetical protein
MTYSESIDSSEVAKAPPLSSDDLNREIRCSAVDFSFGELLNLHRENEIIIQPEYQRLFRWSNEQRSRLIESILLGLPIPPIFLIENDRGVLELIDGLQRVSSVLQFLDHTAIAQPELTLSGCDILASLNGHTYESLPPVLRLKLKRTPIRATIINRSGDPLVKYEMFKRLNTGGSLLSPQEIRNCSSRMIEGGDKFYEAIQSLAGDDCFKGSIRRLPSSSVEQRGDEELVLRYFAVTDYRDGFKGNIEEWLDGLMEEYLFNRKPFDLALKGQRFRDIFRLIFNKLSDQAFTRFSESGESTGRLAPAYYEAVVAAFDKHYDLLSNIPSADLKARLQEAFDSQDFKDATGPGANTIAKLNRRIEVASRYLSGHVDS